MIGIFIGRPRHAHLSAGGVLTMHAIVRDKSPLQVRERTLEAEIVNPNSGVVHRDPGRPDNLYSV